jgi:hypothetical protein
MIVQACQLIPFVTLQHEFLLCQLLHFFFFYNNFFDMSTSKACHEVSNFPIKWDVKDLKTLGMLFRSLQVSIKRACERSIMGLG